MVVTWTKLESGKMEVRISIPGSIDYCAASPIVNKEPEFKEDDPFFSN
jgi:hypothetical protein